MKESSYLFSQITDGVGVENAIPLHIDIRRTGGRVLIYSSNARILVISLRILSFNCAVLGVLQTTPEEKITSIKIR
jgi:hypothetical protein